MRYFKQSDQPSRKRENDIEWDEEAVTEHRKSQAASHFSPDDANVGIHMSDSPEESQDRWYHLKKLNDGVGDPDRKQHNRQSERKEDVKLVASECGLSYREIETGIRLAEHVNCRLGGRIKAEDVMLAIVILVAHPNRDIINNQRFEKFINDWNTSRDMVEKTIPKVKSQFGIE